ncbi:TadE/TadG family type IV pilus assembly protein [Cohaesibacter celericrescens]|nr:TadE/TadG family type IV pilus assembly protein [Cohaesibacter celericrescens]
MAVEFALIGPVFVGCLGFVGMAGYMFLASATLEQGVREAGRHIRVGKVATAGTTRDQFKDKICSYVSLSDEYCVANLVIDVDSAPTIEDLQTAPPYKDGKLDGSTSTYDPGDSSDYVMVKAYLSLGTLSDLFGLMGATNTNTYTVSSATVFRSEPF